MSNLRLHTTQELEDIAKTDFERFKQIAKYYYENDFTFFEETLIPIIEKHKKNAAAFETIDQKQQEIVEYQNPVQLSHKNNTSKEKSNVIYYAIVAVILVSISAILYYFLIYKNNYRQGLSHIKDKNYSAAIDKLTQIDSTSNSFKEIEPALNFAKASKFFEDQDYRQALLFYKKVMPDSEFYEEAKANIDKIINDPNILYAKAINHINAKEYDDALNDLQRIRPSDLHYNKSQSKIMYIRGITEYNLGDYSNADTYFKQVEKTDEFYQDIISKQPAIDTYLNTQRDLESHKSYAKTLIQIADDIEDEHQLFDNVGTFLYTKNTYLPRLIQLRSQLNNSYYGATNKSSSLTDFKSLILKWVNGYINYAEDINTYGFYTNYNGDKMWANYGYTLRNKNDLNKELHQKLIKKYKELQSLYGLN